MGKIVALFLAVMLVAVLLGLLVKVFVGAIVFFAACLVAGYFFGDEIVGVFKR